MPTKVTNRPARMENQQFARRLHQAMTDKGMNNSDLARALWGETEDTKGYKVAKNRDRIAVYLRGEGLPAPATLHKMANILDVPKEELVPDLSTPTIDRSHPEVAMKMISGDANKVQLQINGVVPLAVAVEIIKLYEQAKKAGEARGADEEDQ
jgi:transcriptional regulator with XRE-family HTH domain